MLDVLKDIFILMILHNFVIALVSVPKFEKVAIFAFFFFFVSVASFVVRFVFIFFEIVSGWQRSICRIILFVI
jgi:hypothetical protein